MLLGVTGGIAAYKACSLTRLLTQVGTSVQVVMTTAATRFVGPDTFAALSGRAVYTDVFEAPGHVLHVELAHEADLAVVAPATANVIAKLALGLADDLLTSTLLESTCPLLVAPAMHSGMWEHPATEANLRALAERGTRIVGPAIGPLAAGDEGMGRMSEPEEILSALEEVTSHSHDLAGRHIVVTAGPTQEPIDAVRFVGNRSSGKMGLAVATEAAGRGAHVTVVTGPVAVEWPSGAQVVGVSTAEEMREAVLEAFDSADALVMAAAVADFRPERAEAGKIKKQSGPPELTFIATPDILTELGRDKRDRVLVGFAAETADLATAGRAKLEGKALDLIVVNEVGRPGTGFGSETTDAMILSRSGEDSSLRTWSKLEIAKEICDRLAKLIPAAQA